MVIRAMEHLPRVYSWTAASHQLGWRQGTIRSTPWLRGPPIATTSNMQLVAFLSGVGLTGDAYPSSHGPVTTASGILFGRMVLWVLKYSHHCSEADEPFFADTSFAAKDTVQRCKAAERQ